ncbi:MAG: 6-phosphogluconolactonase [Myxococcota bacterium]
MNGPARWHSLADAGALRARATELILDAAARAIRARGRFLVALAGGSTPLGVYASLRAATTDWAAWQIYFGDERCLPRGDAGRNSTLAAKAWLDHVPVNDEQVRPIPAELGALRGAAAYAAELRSVGQLDLVLLGLGVDGHTASLFPGHDWGTAPEAPDALAVLDAPLPPAQRVSLSAARLSRSRAVLFLVEGEHKRGAVSRWRAGESLPAAAIRPPAGVDVLVTASLIEGGVARRASP